MKILLIFAITLFPSLLLRAEELDKIELIVPASYERAPDKAENLKSSSGVWLGNLAGRVNVGSLADIGSLIKNKLEPYKDKLSKYFKKNFKPAPEMDMLVDSVILEAKTNVIGYHQSIFGTTLNSMTDAKAIALNKFIGNRLIGRIADKILEGEGVTDPVRRDLWVKKILAPFNSCIEKSKNSLYDADNCMRALTTSLVPSVGIGLVYELSRSKLNSGLPDEQRESFNTEQVDVYKECMKKTAAEPSDVKNCALQTMKVGIQKVTDLRLSKTINSTSSSTDKAKIIKQAVWLNYKKCTEKVGTNAKSKLSLSEEFMNCIDGLVASTGMKLVEDKITNHQSFKTNFSETELDKISSEKVLYFKECVDDQKKKNQRKEGMIDTSKCVKNITLSLASKQVLKSSEGKMNPQEAEILVDNLVNHKFNECLGPAPSDERSSICTGELTKGATKSIVLAYEKKKIKVQLNADETPGNLKPVEDQFVSCVDKPYPAEEVSKSLDECTKQFALEFARNLGGLKVTTLMKSVLGTPNYNDQKQSIDSILGKYNDCLDDLKKIGMKDGLLDKLTICTDGLQHRGLNFVSNTLNTWMSTEEKDAATIMIKNEFASLIPCLSGLIPASPYSPQMQQNVDSALKPVALLLAQYIEYSPENAKQTLDQVIKKLSSDLKDIDKDPDSRKELIDMLYANGALDQFLKSMVRSQVILGFEKMSESELPLNLRTLLTNKENFDKIFDTPEGKSIKDLVMEKILKPILLEQASLKSPLIVAGMDAIKDKVSKMLVYSPHFGDQIIKSSLQSKINNMGGFTRFVAKVIYGRNSLDWEKVRTTSEGKLAEEYIRENVLLPKIKGQPVSKEEEKKIMIEAEKLVKIAVKNYD